MTEASLSDANTLSIKKLSIMTLSITKLSIMTLSITTLSKMTRSITTLSIMTLSIMAVISGTILNQKHFYKFNGTAGIRHQCRKTAVLSCHRFLINSGVEEMNNI